MNISTNKRILYMDGIKGISAFIIFLHHFMLTFFPSSYYGNECISYANGFDTYLASSPLGVIINGNFFVNIFLIISGYVITYQILYMESEKIGLFLFKRYLRFLYTFFVYGFVIFLFNLKNNLTSNTDSVKSIIIDIYKIANSIFLGILFKGDTYLGGHLWTFKYIFLGGIFISIIVSTCRIFDLKKSIIIPMILSIILLFLPSFENINYLTVLFGCSLCLLIESKNEKLIILWNFFKRKKYLIYLIFIISIFLGGTPSGIENPQNIYKYIKLPFCSSIYWHSIASLLFLFSIIELEQLQKLFSNKFFLFLSKISLWMYLFHNFIINISESLFKILYQYNYLIAATICFFVDLFAITILSFLLQKYISPFYNNLYKVFINNISSSTIKK